MNKYIKAFLDDNNLKVNEKFKIDGNDYYYFFSNDGYLCYETPALGWVSVSSYLVDILNGKYKIKKPSPIPTERFIPEEKEEYWFVDRYGNIDFGTYHKAGRHDYIIAHTLIFKTKEQAEDYKWFSDKADEYKKPFVPGKDNVYFYYDYDDKKVYEDCHFCYQSQGVIYFGNDESSYKFLEEVGEERIKKYMFDIWQEQD